MTEMKDDTYRIIAVLILAVMLCVGLYFTFHDDGTTGKQVNEVEAVAEQEITVLAVLYVDEFSASMRVIHDNERNVTCWKLANGMSCIPDHMLSP